MVDSNKEDDLEYTDRGFAKYGEFKDEHGQTIRLQESSAVGRPKVWIFCKQDAAKNWYKNKLDTALAGVAVPSPELLEMSLETGTPILNVEQAKLLIDELRKFVAHAESDENWRNNEEYIENFG